MSSGVLGWYLRCYIVYDQELVWSVAFLSRRLLVSWPSVSIVKRFGAFCSVCYGHVVRDPWG